MQPSNESGRSINRFPDAARDMTIDMIQAGDVVGFDVQITPLDLEHFGNLTGDRSPLHMSEEYARAAGFEGRVVHGLLLASVMSTIAGMLLPGRSALLLSERMDFLEPVMVGSTVAVSARVAHVSQGTDTITLTVHALYGGVLVARGALMIRIRREDRVH